MIPVAYAVELDGRVQLVTQLVDIPADGPAVHADLGGERAGVGPRTGAECLVDGHDPRQRRPCVVIQHRRHRFIAGPGAGGSVSIFEVGQQPILAGRMDLILPVG